MTYARWRSAFAAALDPRLYPIDHLDTLVRKGRAQLWASDRSALVTELRPFPSGAWAIHTLVAAGDMAEIVGELRPQAEAWARGLGCTLSIVESREGWARALKPHGYAPFQVSLIKSLS